MRKRIQSSNSNRKKLKLKNENKRTQPKKEAKSVVLLKDHKNKLKKKKLLFKVLEVIYCS